MIIYDTNEYIKQINKNKNAINGDFVVIDFNIYEYLKGKNLADQKREFLKLDKYVCEKSKKYYLRNSLSKKEKLLNNPNTPFEYKFKIAQKVCNITSRELVLFCITTLFILMTICEIIKNKTTVINDEIHINSESDYEISVLNRVLTEESNLLESSKTNKMAKNLFAKSKEETDLWFIALYNTVAQTLSAKLPNITINTITSKHINLNSLLGKGSKAIKEEVVEKYIDVFVTPKTKIYETRKLYSKLISSILVDNKAFEFNHISDLYMQYVAEEIGASYISSDNKKIDW